MFPFGLLENPQKRLSKGNSAIVIIVGAGSAILLDYMYNEHYELLYKFFLAIGVIGVVIYALGISFFRTKRLLSGNKSWHIIYDLNTFFITVFLLFFLFYRKQF